VYSPRRFAVRSPLRPALFLVALVTAIFLPARVAAAPLITSFSGSYHNNTTTSSTASFTSGAVDNGATSTTGPVTGTALNNASVSNLTISNLTNFAVVIPSVMNTATGDIPTTFTVGGATFTMTSPVSLSSLVANNGFVFFSTQIVLTSGSVSGVDLSLFTA